MVESLTGYIVRLAEAHCVSSGVLYWKEIREVAAKGNIFTFRVSNHQGYSTHAINGFGAPAADFVKALEMLTGRPDLRYLTLLTWGQVLARIGLLRRCRAWCESCLHAWRDSGQVIYEPLLWTLQSVIVCPYHRRRLRQVCSHCENQIGPLDSRSRPGHCCRCGQTLVPRTIEPTELPALSDNELTWSIWVANSLGELLASAPQIHCPPERLQLAEKIRLCVDRTSSGNASAFAQLMHAGRGDVVKWRRGKTLPRLSILLNMAYCQVLSLLNLLCESPTVIASRDVLRPELVKPSGPVKRAIKRPSWRIDTAEVSKVLRAALKEDPPPSATQVMKRLTCGEVVVRCHFSEICSELAQRYAQYRVVRAIARKMHAAEEVRRVAHELHAKGIKLTRQHIRPHLSSSDYLNLKEGRAALDEVRSQLACKVSNKGAS